MNKSIVKTSKFLSLVLRHKPETIGLKLDESGWAEVEELLALSAKQGTRITRELLREVVRENDKQRFSLSPDEAWIRANQGHSISVDLELDPQRPPDELFHGTATRFIASIESKGLLKGNRQHVHLSSDVETATKVGKRHGKPVVLTVAAGKMHADGHEFFLSENGVWLTGHVPAVFVFESKSTSGGIE